MYVTAHRCAPSRHVMCGSHNIIVSLAHNGITSCMTPRDDFAPRSWRAPPRRRQIISALMASRARGSNIILRHRALAQQRIAVTAHALAAQRAPSRTFSRASLRHAHAITRALSAWRIFARAYHVRGVRVARCAWHAMCRSRIA